MRQSRLKLLDQPACYHVICRITQGQLWLGDKEKAYLSGLLHRVAHYCGVEVLTFCVMSNHFHLLIRVPEKAAADAKLEIPELLARVQHLYGTEVAGELRQLLEPRGAPDALGPMNEQWELHLGRMHELSVFMKLLKQRFTMWHNHRHGTRGTLWTERFKSVLVESRAEGMDPLGIVAAYIDLNPVRAGVAKTAEEYAYSGIGSAVSANPESQHGLIALTKASGAAEAISRYLTWLAGAFSDENPETSAHLAGDLRRRQAAFVKGAIVGSAVFVLEILTTLMNLRRNVGPMIHTAGPLGEGLWVGKRFRKD